MQFADEFWGTGANAYGGLLQVVVEDGALVGKELLGPAWNQELSSDVSKRDLFKIYGASGNSGHRFVCLRPVRFRFDEAPEFHPLSIELKHGASDTLSSDHSESNSAESAQRSETTARGDGSTHLTLVCSCVASELHRRRDDYRNVSAADDMTSRTDLRYYKGYEKGFEFSFIAQPLLELNAILEGNIPCRRDGVRLPLPLGMWKCTFGKHQIELLMLRYATSSSWPKKTNLGGSAEVPVEGRFLEGVKLTGDPNVPSLKVSFNVDLNKPVFPTAKEQEALPDLRKVRELMVVAQNGAVDGVDEDLMVDVERSERQSFVLPRFVDVDDKDFAFLPSCRGRFQAQVRMMARDCYEFVTLYSFFMSSVYRALTRCVLPLNLSSLSSTLFLQTDSRGQIQIHVSETD